MTMKKGKRKKGKSGMVNISQKQMEVPSQHNQIFDETEPIFF